MRIARERWEAFANQLRSLTAEPDSKYRAIRLPGSAYDEMSVAEYVEDRGHERVRVRVTYRPDFSEKAFPSEGEYSIYMTSVSQHEEERLVAEGRGWEVYVESPDGKPHAFRFRDDYVWRLLEGWQSADLSKGGYYANHKRFDTLEEALDRRKNEMMEEILSDLEKRNLSPTGRSLPANHLRMHHMPKTEDE